MVVISPLWKSVEDAVSAGMNPKNRRDRAALLAVGMCRSAALRAGLRRKK
jgi:hypothetical protein